MRFRPLQGGVCPRGKDEEESTVISVRDPQPTVRELTIEMCPLPLPPALKRYRMDRLIGHREQRVGRREGREV
jgi:hypothetical protein